MRIAEFIAANIESILVDWESFARSIWPQGAPAEPAELRDSAEQILRAIIADMGTAQTQHQQSEKSKGRGIHGDESNRLDHASQVHGAGRVGSGLALAAVVAEYRSLRASVLRLWRRTNPSANQHDLDDLTRFNEAIDQSLSLAVRSFMHRIDSGRKMFLGILAHDLRNPLAAITLSAKLASMLKDDPSQLSQQLAQIVISAHSMSELITNLIDFSATAIGGTLPMNPGPCDLHAICHDVVRELQAAHPGRNIHCNVRGELNCTADSQRIRQMIGNLIANAIQHGSPNDPVDLTIDGTSPQTLLITVHNTGDPIPPDVLPTIFDPLTRAPTSVQQRPTQGSIGLGLYIVRKIATAHGGSAELTSTPTTGTTATIHLPRNAASLSSAK